MCWQDILVFLHDSLCYTRCGITRYVDPTGKDRTYEIVERTTRPELAGIDSVDIVSKLISFRNTSCYCLCIALMAPASPTYGNEERRICLVVVYRAAVERYAYTTVNGKNYMHNVCVRFSIEFPAGLVNAGETLLQAAQRELAEETGYSGDIKVTVPCIIIETDT